MPSLEARLQRLEQGAADNALCTDPRCLHMGFLRLARSSNGLPEYPLPPHAKNPSPSPRGWLVDALKALNRQPGESAEDYSERMKPKPYVDPYFTGEPA
jgi:hypothetical protein